MSYVESKKYRTFLCGGIAAERVGPPDDEQTPCPTRTRRGYKRYRWPCNKGLSIFGSPHEARTCRLRVQGDTTILERPNLDLPLLHARGVSVASAGWRCRDAHNSTGKGVEPSQVPRNASINQSPHSAPALLYVPISISRPTSSPTVIAERVIAALTPL